MGFGSFGGRSGGSGGFGAPRQMHDITCSECGAAAQVPFKPADGRPVYCRDCYGKKKAV